MDLKTVQLKSKKEWNRKSVVDFTLGFEIR
jgi:hypothetical protein